MGVAEEAIQQSDGAPSDDDGVFVTQRQFPSMARITCLPRADGIEIFIPDHTYRRTMGR